MGGSLGERGGLSQRPHGGEADVSSGERPCSLGTAVRLWNLQTGFPPLLTRGRDTATANRTFYLSRRKTRVRRQGGASGLRWGPRLELGLCPRCPRPQGCCQPSMSQRPRVRAADAAIAIVTVRAQGYLQSAEAFPGASGGLWEKSRPCLPQLRQRRTPPPPPTSSLFQEVWGGAEARPSRGEAPGSGTCWRLTHITSGCLSSGPPSKEAASLPPAQTGKLGTGGENWPVQG